MTKTLLTVAEAAEVLNLGRTKLYQLIRLGQIETVTIGSARRIPADAIDAFVESIRVVGRQTDSR